MEGSEQMNRTAVIEALLDEMLKSIPDRELAAYGCKHIYGVAQAATLLAKKRGLDPEIAAITAMLHDYTKYSENEDERHAEKSADAVLPLLAKSGLFTVCEVGVIVTAIQNHSKKDETGTPYDELLKDADVFQHYLVSGGRIVKEKYKERTEKVLAELGIS